jgi:hypothetical protein
MRLQDIFQESVQLDEVNMSPTNLKLMASKIDARAGMEFEMIVPDTQGEDDGDLEADYDQDERCSDIDDIVAFFEGGEGMNGPQEIRHLSSQLQDAYMEWSGEQMWEAWDSEKHDAIRDWITENEWDQDEQIHEWFNNESEHDFDSDQIDRIIELGSDPRRARARAKNEEELKEINKLIELYDEAEEGANEMLETWVEMAIDDQNSMYENAHEEWQNNSYHNDHSESDWLRSAGIRYMSDVEREYTISWPYFTRSGGDGRSVEQVADEFRDYTGFDVDWNTSYHGGGRKPGHYTVEPDGSLSGDNPGDTGLEFISPPKPLSELLEDLAKVVAWAKQSGCYTNDSTGLHMNVSVPNYSLDKLDFVKLALFLGDEYVLKAFGRESNTYCASAMKKIQSGIKPEARTEVLKRMGQELSLAASKLIHSGITSKYTSINTKDTYIEFRSPGGDWLATDLDKLTNTLLRFTVAMSIAVDPNAYKQEYAKKLYKLIGPADDGTNTLQAFANFKAGEISLVDLQRTVQSAKISRELVKNPKTGKKYWFNVQYGRQRMEVVATSKEDARRTAAGEWRMDANSAEAGQFVITPLRPYEEPKQEMRPSNPDGEWVLLAYDDAAKKMLPIYRFMAASHEDADLVRDQWAKAHDQDPERIIAHPDATKRYGQPAAKAASAPQDIPEVPLDIEIAPPRTAATTTITPTGPGPWEVYSRINNNAVYRLAHTNRQAAQTEAQTWLRQNNHNADEYGVRTRPATTANNTAPWWYIKRVDDVEGGGEYVHRYQAPDVHSAYDAYVEYLNAHDLSNREYQYGRGNPPAGQ